MDSLHLGHFSNDQWDLFKEAFKAILTGLVTFGSAYYIFWRGKKKDDDKEVARLQDIRMDLYFVLKYYRTNLIKKSYLIKKSTSSDINRTILTMQKRFAYMFKMENEIDIDPLSIFKKEDIFKILLFNHNDKQNLRISSLYNTFYEIKNINVYNANFISTNKLYIEKKIDDKVFFSEIKKLPEKFQYTAHCIFDLLRREYPELESDFDSEFQNNVWESALRS